MRDVVEYLHVPPGSVSAARRPTSATLTNPKMITLTEEQLSSSGTTAAGKDSKKSPASSGRRLDTSDLQEGRGGRRYVNGTFPREQDRDSKFSSSAPSSRIRVLILSLIHI